jgi:hypothetical protein
MYNKSQKYLLNGASIVTFFYHDVDKNVYKIWPKTQVSQSTPKF